MPLFIIHLKHRGGVYSRKYGIPHPGGGSTPINRVYGDDPLDRVWFSTFVIDREFILLFVSSRFEFHVIDRVLLLLTGLGRKHRWSLLDWLINETLIHEWT